MKNKLLDLIKQDKKVAVAIDGSKASVALLDAAFGVLGDDAAGFAVISAKTPITRLGTIKKLDGWYPMSFIKVDVSKVKNLDINTDLGKQKYTAMVTEAILHEANKKGFWTVYSGFTADGALFSPDIFGIVEDLGMASPFVELDVTSDDVEAAFPNINI